MENIPDRYKQTIKFCQVFFSILILGGCTGYYFYNDGMIGGFSIAVALLSFGSFLHFRLKQNRISKHIDTKMTWLLLSLFFLGLFLILLNYFRQANAFQYGVGAGIAGVAAISYVLELLLVWLSNIR